MIYSIFEKSLQCQTHDLCGPKVLILPVYSHDACSLAISDQNQPNSRCDETVAMKPLDQTENSDEIKMSLTKGGKAVANPSQKRQAHKTKLASELHRRRKSDELSPSNMFEMPAMGDVFKVLMPKDINSFSFILEPATSKRFCREKIESWLPKSVSEITMDFSRPGMVILRPQAVVHATPGPAKKITSWKEISTAQKLGLDVIAQPHISKSLSIVEIALSGNQRKGEKAFADLKEVNPIQNFKPYKRITRNISEDLKSLLLKPLSPNDLKYRGSIYIFSHPGNFGHLKIGRSEDVRRRLKQWSNQCKKKMVINFPDFADERSDNQQMLQKVAHICRVEALVHLELLEYRRIEVKCPGCSRDHKEWFEISEKRAIAVANKWMAWMRTEPYEECGTEGRKKLVLKAEEMERLRELSQPLFPKLGPENQAREERVASLRPRLSSSGPWRDKRDKLGTRPL